MDVVLTRVRGHANIETFFLLVAAATMAYLPHAEGSASWVTYNGLTSAAATNRKNVSMFAWPRTRVRTTSTGISSADT